jgi:hypothetical protein
VKTSPAAIQELVSYINKEVTQIKLEMKVNGPDHKYYTYWEDRLQYCEQEKAKLWSIMGKNIPKRDRSNGNRRL